MQDKDDRDDVPELSEDWFKSAKRGREFLADRKAVNYEPPTTDELRALLKRWQLTGAKAATQAGLADGRQVRRYTGGQTRTPFAVLFTLARRVGGIDIRPDVWRSQLEVTKATESSHLTLEAEQDDPMDDLLGHSITYRIAVGPQAGRKVLTLQTLPGYQDIDDDVGQVSGFSVHAGVAAGANERDKLERLCRYVSRPPVSEQRLSLTTSGQVRLELKTPYRDGTTHVVFSRLDFLAKLAALVPKPRVNLIRFNGIFAPNSKLRARVTPSGRGKGSKRTGTQDEATPAERRAAMTWAPALRAHAAPQRLKRVFNIDVTTCAACGGPVKVIAAIDDPVVIQAILEHFETKGAMPQADYRPDARAPPLRELLH